MNSSRAPLYTIGGIIVIAVAGVIAYAVSQNAAAPASTDTNRATSESSQTKEDPDNESTDAVQADEVEIKNYAYSPATITVKTVTKVTWTNQDSVEHTVTTTGGAPAKIDSGLFGKGESFSFTFEKAGTYEYFCEPHPYMKGTVVVTE